MINYITINFDKMFLIYSLVLCPKDLKESYTKILIIKQTLCYYGCNIILCYKKLKIQSSGDLRRFIDFVMKYYHHNDVQCIFLFKKKTYKA